jgi:chromosome segregation protein
MLYLKEATLNRFKSFAHASLMFGSGFTCIVGPNGSGKSNICDALLFALGENSLRRLRVGKLESLVSSGSRKRKGALATAYARVILDGEDRFEIIRWARTDGKGLYKVNGKRTTRQEVLEILRKYRFGVNETNTITQGEITRMINLNPRERRQLIDIAAGIKEFEDKKMEALRELEKVDQKINEAQIMLGERTGFLKELEKEKKDAEMYMHLTSDLKSLNYTMLIHRAEDAQEAYDRHSKDMAIADSKKQRLVVEKNDVEARVSSLSAQRSEFAKALGTSTASMGDLNGRLELINREMAVISVEISNFRKEIENGNYTLLQAEAQKSGMESRISRNMARLAEIEPLLSKLSSSGRPAVDSNRIRKMAERMKMASERSAVLRDKIEGFMAEAGKLSTEIAISSEKGKEYDRELARIGKESDSIKEKKTELSARLDIVRTKRNKILEEITAGTAIISAKESEKEKIEVQIIEAREQRAVAFSREDGIASKLSKAFSEKTGLYGTVSQLCSYEDRFAYAVDAAAGSRLNYLVVKDISTASGIIEYMKKNKMGRATFIPIDDIRVAESHSDTENLRSGTAAGTQRMLDLIKYDIRFRKVFEYVFGNTYIISKITDAKGRLSHGHRYVTLEGDVVESSGVVSGGSQKGRQSAQLLESAIRDLQGRRDTLVAELKGIEGRLLIFRKEAAAADMEIGSIAEAMKGVESAALALDSASSRIKLEIDGGKAGLEVLAKRKDEVMRSVALLEKERASESGAGKEMQDEYIAMLKAIEGGGAPADADEAEKAEMEYDRLKTEKAELGKENQMTIARMGEVGAGALQVKEKIDAWKKEVSAREVKADELLNAKHMIEEEIRKSSRANRDAYGMLEKLDAEISGLSSTHGRLGAEIESAERTINESRMLRAQVEVRLVDLKTEIAAYGTGIERSAGSYEDMERRAAEVSAGLAELGTVNMKAPEMYMARKKDADEVMEKTLTLGAEKDAVLKMIQEIDSKKLNVFSETLESVNKNFMQLYGYIFPGSAKIELDNPKDPFSSGLQVRVESANKSRRNLDSMSGGEKSLVILMLVFAIHTHRPSSIYIFDEIDSALDKENSKKLSSLIKQMSSSAQFVVVSHNDSLIVDADVAIGVSKRNDESQAVGLEVSAIMNKKPAGA